MAFIFDIDGVLADSSHRAHHLRKRPPDWQSYRAGIADDKPIAPIVALASALHAARQSVLLVTSRDAATRPQTEQWLESHGVQYTALFMRPAGDTRLEYDVKSDLIADARDAGYDPIVLIDDRDDAIRAAIGQRIAALQVHHP